MHSTLVSILVSIRLYAILITNCFNGKNDKLEIIYNCCFRLSSAVQNTWLSLRITNCYIPGSAQVSRHTNKWIGLLTNSLGNNFFHWIVRHSRTVFHRVFSLTWPASMQIYWNKKRVQLPEDWFGTPTWPPFLCFGTPIWPPWRHVKRLSLYTWVTHFRKRLPIQKTNFSGQSTIWISWKRPALVGDGENYLGSLFYSLMVWSLRKMYTLCFLEYVNIWNQHGPTVIVI